MRCDGRMRLKVVRLDAVVWLDSDGSMLRSRGVIKPPPSTAMGMINSRGLFLMGCEVPVTVDCDRLVPVVSVSESAVDWRDSEPELQARMKIIVNSPTQSRQVEGGERRLPSCGIGIGASIGLLRGRSLYGDYMLLWLQACCTRLQRRLDGAIRYGTLTWWCTTQISHRMLHLGAEAHRRLWRLLWLLCNAWLDIQLNFRFGIDFTTRQSGRLERYGSGWGFHARWCLSDWRGCWKSKLKLKFSSGFYGYLAWLESEHKWLARRFNQVLLRAKNSGRGVVVG